MTARPTEVTPEALGFTPQRAVRWLSPRELARAGVSVVLSGIFGAYADKRELQDGGVFAQDTFDHGNDDEVWIDYVSDLGDGFDATYSVASLLAAERLTVAGPEDNATVDLDEALPRGSVLVMGGDEVYPIADAFAYEERTTRVYAAALPQAAEPRPVLYAVPGNHDWYDGLTAFLRVFAQRQDVGGWRTAQRRSYFALRLPQRWWLLAVDVQLDTYIDEPQLAYFRRVAAAIGPGDGIILCTAKPSWYSAARGDHSSFGRLEYFAKSVLADTGAHIRLVLTGDAHHYARYVAPGTGQILLTSGLGGAYTSPTHHLDERIAVPPRLARPADAGTAPEAYELAEATWPPRARSRRLSLGAFRLPFRNPGLWALLGGVHAAFTTALLSGSLMWSVALGLLILLGAVGFAKPERPGLPRRLAYGLPHGLAQLGLAGGGYVAAARLTAGWPDLAASLAAAPVVALVVGFLAAELVATYLVLAAAGRVNINELFAAQSLEHHKGFVRLHLDPTGRLTVYPIGLERSARRWWANPQAPPGDPWLVPAEPLRPRLIEAPFTLSRDPADAPLTTAATR